MENKLNEYQSNAKVTWLLGASDDELAKESYLMSGLAGEVGELVSLFAKGIRDGVSDMETHNNLIGKELGDILWFVAILADYHGWTLEEIANLNIEKLRSRMQRNTLGGSGDER